MAKVVTFGEVMLRLSTPGALRFAQARQFDATFGGGEANAAVSLANYGIDTEFVTRLPDNGVDVSSGEVEASKYRSVCEQLMSRFPRVSKVVITLRGSVNASHNTWSSVLWDGRTLYESKRYDITHIVDRVGGGDSFMGGLIYGLLTYDNDAEALEFATAASCLKHTIFGDYNRVTVLEDEVLAVPAIIDYKFVHVPFGQRIA